MKLISTSSDKTVRLWDPAAARKKEVIIRLGTPVLAVAISRNGAYMATVKRTGISEGGAGNTKPFTFQLWDFKSQSEEARFSFGEGKGLNPTIVFSPDSKQVAVSDVRILHFYDLPTLKPLKPEGSRGVVYAADNSWLAYVHNDTNIVKRASLTAPEVVIGRADLRQLALSPNGKILVTSSVSGAIEFRDPSDGHPLGPPLTNHALSVVAMAFTPDSKTLVTAGWDGHLGIWDVERRQLRAFPRGHNNQFNWATISPDGGTIASGGEDSFLRLWNVARAQEIAVLQGHTDSINCVAFSPDGQWLASASDDGTVRLWHAPATD
jgi:WD40 repeat protein